MATGRIASSHSRLYQSTTRLVYAACLLAGLFLPGVAIAQTYSSTVLGWDPNATDGATLGGAGGGTWDNGLTADWWNGNAAPGNDVVWASGDTAVFTGTAGPVTIASGGVTADGLQFYSSGYTIGGNTLTLGGAGTPTINMNGNTATISTAITGNSGLTFNGGTNGVLTIGNGTNSDSGVNYTGNTTVNSGTLRFVDAINFESESSADAITVNTGATISFYVDSSGTGFGNDGANEALGTTTNGLTTTIEGNGTFQKTGPGILALGGQGVGNVITFDLGAGAVIDVEGGTLRNGGWAGAVWTNNLASLNIASGATFDMWDGHEVMVDALTGAGSVNKNQSSGGTEVLDIGVNGGSGTFTGLIQNSNVNGGGVGILKSGSGTETFTNASNSYIGGTTLAGGELNISADGALGATSGTLTFTGGALQAGASFALSSSRNVVLSSSGTFDTNGNTITVPGAITGGGSLRVTGGGTLVLSGTANTYSGGTTISSGTLRVGDGVSSNGSLPGAVYNNGTLAFANPTASTYVANIFGPGVAAATGSGTLTLSGAIRGSLQVASGASVSVNSSSNTGLLALYSPYLSSNASQVSNYSTLPNLQAALSSTIVPTSATSGLATTATVLNYNYTGAGFPGTYTNGNTIFDAYYSGMLNVTTAGTYLFQTSSDDGSMLWIDGTNVVSSDYQQGTTTRSGSITLTAGEHDIVVGYFQGGGGLALDVQMGTAGGGSSTLADLSTSMTNGASITPDVLFGSLQGTGNVSLATGNMILGTDNTNQTFGGIISGIGAVMKLGTGIQTFTGANTYSGGTTLTAGELNINSDAALGATSGTLTFQGGALQAGATFSLDPGRSVVLASGYSGTFDTNNNTLTVPGVISGGGSLIVTGGGTLILTGASNTLTGGTTVSSGTLQIGDGAISNGSLPGNVVNNAALAFNNPTAFAYSGKISGTGVTNLIGAGPLTLSGTISGTQRVSYSGAGGATLSGNSTYTGGTTINSGTLTAGGAGLGFGTVNIAPGATLSVSTSNTGLLGLYYNRTPANLGLGAYQSSIGIGGTPSLALLSPTLDFAANGSAFPAPYNSGATNFEAYYSGEIDILTAGSYYFNTRSDDGSALSIDGNLLVSNTAGSSNNSSAVSLSAGEHQITLAYYQGGGGYGLIAQMGTSLSSMADINTSNPLIQLSPDETVGSLQGSGNVALTTGGLVMGFDNSNQSFSGLISGAGGVMKVGTGTQAFTNTGNSYTGGTIIAGGVLNIGADSELGVTSGTLTVAGGTLQAAAALTLDPTRITVLGSGTTGTIDTNGYAVSIPGTLTGAGGLTKIGVGTLTLSGANINFTGGATVTAGTLVLQDTTAFSGTGGSGVPANNLTISSGATLELLVDNGSQLQFDGGTISGSGTLIVNTNGSVLFGSDNHAENISMGSGGLIDVQAGLLRNEYFEGIWTNNLASLEVDAGATFNTWDSPATYTDALTGAGTIDKGQNNSNPLYIGVNNGSGTFSGVIKNSTGNTTIIKQGTGTETFSGNNNTYSGTTTINNGTLRITNTSGSAFGSGAVTIGDQVAGHTAALSGTGIFTGSLTVNGPGMSGNGGHIAPGVNANGNFGSIGTLTTGALTLNIGANLDFDFGTPGTGSGALAGTSDLIAVNGALTLPASGAVVLNLADNANANGQGSIGLGTYQLIDASSIANFNPVDFSIGATPAPGDSYTFTSTGTEIDLTIGVSSYSGLDGANNPGAWNDAGNWNGSIPGSTTGTANSDTASFNNGGNGYLNIVVDAGRNVRSITFDTAAAGAYVIGTTGGNPLLLTNAGTIQTTSTVVNPQTINAPLVLEGTSYTISSNAASSAATLNIGGGITGAAGTTVLTLNGSNTGANTISSVIADGSATHMAVAMSGPGNWTLSADNTFSGGLSVTGGTLVLSAANNYSGGTTVSGGTLRVGNSAAIPSASLLTLNGTGTLDLAGANLNLAGGLTDGGSLGGASTGTILTSSGTGTLTLADDNTGFGGVISNGAGTVRVVANAGTGGYMVLSGASTYTGGTTINTELEAWSAGALGNGLVTVNDGATLVLKGNTDGINYAQNLVLGNGSGGAANLVLNSDNALRNPTWSGSITLTPGSTDTFALGGANNNAGTLNVTGLVTGGGVLTKNGANLTLNLSGANPNWTGGTQINAGIVSVGVFTTGNGSGGANNSLGTGPVNVAAGAALAFSNNNLNISNNITLNGTRTGGSLIGAIATGGQTDTLSGTLTLAQTSNVTTFWSDKFFYINGQVTGPGGLIVDDYNLGAQPGSNIILDNSANNYQGGTTVNANSGGQSNPILYAGAANVIPAGSNNVSLTVNGQFNMQTFSQSINGLAGSGLITSSGSPVLTLAPSGTATFSGVISGPVAVTMNGSGTQIFSGVNTYSGTTTISSGTLQLGDGTANNGSVAGNIADNASLVFANFNTQSYGGVISGSGTVTETGANTLTLTGSNLYTGNTDVTTGTLTIGSAGSIVGTGVNVSSGGTLRVASGGSISTATNLTNNGATNLNNSTSTIANLNGTNTSAALTLNSTALTITGGGSYAGAIADGSSSGSLIVGGGTLTLSGSSSYSSGTQVNSGTLRVANSGSTTSATGTGPVTVNSGATLAGSGSTTLGFISGSVNIAGGATIAPSGGGTANAAGSIGTLTVGSLTLNSGVTSSQLNYQVASTSQPLLDSIAVTGALTLPTSNGGTPVQFNFYPVSSSGNLVLPLGAYPLVTYGSLTPGYNFVGLSVNPADLNGNQATFSTIDLSGVNTLEVTISGGSGSATWSSTGSGPNPSDYGTAANWTPGNVPNGPGQIATFGTGPEATVSLSGTFTVGALVFNSASPTNYTLSGGSLALNNNGSGPSITVSSGSVFPVISTPLTLADGNNSTTTFNVGSGSYLDVSGAIGETASSGQKILLTGGGTLQLDSAANTYTGGTTVSGSTLVLDAASSSATTLGSGPLAINGSSSNVTVTSAGLTVGSLSGTGGGQLNVGGTTTLTVNQTTTSTFNGTLTLNGGLVLANASGNTLTISGAPTLGSSSSITVNSGTLALTNNTNSSANVSGTPTVSVAPSATLQLAGSSNVLSSAVNITTHGSGIASDGALTVVGASTQTVGVISGTAGSGSVTTYAGNTTVGDGSNAANLTATQILQNTLTINAGSTVTIAPSGSGIPADAVAATTAVASSQLASSAATAGNDSGTDPFTAIQAAIASGSISSTKGQQLENRVAAIERLAATDPGLDVSLLEDRALAALSVASVWSSSGTSPLLDSDSGLLAADSGTIGSSSGSALSGATAFAPAADFGGSPSAVPEPSTLLLAAIGGLGLAFTVRRRAILRTVAVRQGRT